MTKRVIYLISLATLQFTVMLSIAPNVVRAQYGPCIPKVLIDPGHGGIDPSGGYNLGTTCWNNLCTERELNLAVALQLGTILTAHGISQGTRYWLTRYDDSKVTNNRRAQMAESLAVDEFISIHHDGNVDTTINRTQMIYCNAATNDTGAYRDSASALALKVGYKIRDTFNITYYSPSVRCDLTVLIKTTMPSVLTEASFITNPSEARRFAYGSGINDEAEAIYEGLCSYDLNGGFAIVENSYSSSLYANGGSVRVDGWWQESPYVTAWGIFEHHDLAVPYQQTFPDGYQRTFFRWSQVWNWHDLRDTSIYSLWYDPYFPISVGIESAYHYFLAYYTGGPYAASINPPADTVYVADTVQIPWSVDAGADSTTAVTIDLDRNGGAGGYTERIVGRDYFDRWWIHNNWIVSGPATSNARLQIKADDYAGNSTTAYSAPFVIYECGQLAVTNETLSTIKPAISELFLSYDANLAHNLTLSVYRLEGASWVLAGTPYAGTSFPAGHTSVTWAIDAARQGQYWTYRMDGRCVSPCGSRGPVRSDSFSVQLVITNSSPEILQLPFFLGGIHCVEYGNNAEVIAVADDPEDGQNLTYWWMWGRDISRAVAISPLRALPALRTTPLQNLTEDVPSSNPGMERDHSHLRIQSI